MPRRLVVEAEARALVTDGMNAGGHIDEAARSLAGARRLPFRVVNRIGRILREGVQDIGDQQFLVLLLVMQADFDNAEHMRGIRGRHVVDQPLDRRVDMGAISGYVLAVRPGDQSALRPRMARTGGDVVGIEQKRKALVENLVARIVRHQQKLLEKPGDVRAVPFRRTGVGHRLHDLVLGRQMRRARFGLGAHPAEGVAPVGARLIRRLRNGAWPEGGAAPRVRRCGARHRGSPPVIQRDAAVDLRTDTNYGRNCSIAGCPGQPGVAPGSVLTGS